MHVAYELFDYFRLLVSDISDRSEVGLRKKLDWLPCLYEIDKRRKPVYRIVDYCLCVFVLLAITCTYIYMQLKQNNILLQHVLFQLHTSIVLILAIQQFSDISIKSYMWLCELVLVRQLGRYAHDVHRELHMDIINSFWQKFATYDRHSVPSRWQTKASCSLPDMIKVLSIEVLEKFIEQLSQKQLNLAGLSCSFLVLFLFEREEM